jgi:hypothetical protein
MNRTKLALAAGALALVASTQLNAQNTCNTDGTAQAAAATNICTVTHTASATVNDVMRLTLSTGTTDLGTPLEADYTAGFKNATGPTATVKSNRSWKVTVVGNASNFSYTGNLTNPNKPASDLLWGTTAGTYGSNMGTSAQLASGTTGTAGATPQAQIFFQTKYNWATDVPGSYSLVVNFTLATP